MKEQCNSRPTSHRNLRALMRIIQRAYIQKDIDSLDDTYDIAQMYSPDIYDDLQTYINGLTEKIRESDREYRIYSEEDIRQAKAALEQRAYGNFDEAMHELECDFNGLDRYRDEDDMASGVFNPELFTLDDRKHWLTFRNIALDLLQQPFGEKRDQAIKDAVAALRSYQQKSFGPFIPTMTATYRRGDEGVSVRIAWVNDHLQLTAGTPLYKELNEHFQTTSPVDSIADFTRSCFPERINNYTLGIVALADLFHYEL